GARSPRGNEPPPRSGIEPLADPLALRASVDEAIVQAVGLPRPELDPLGADHVARPERRPLHLLPLEAPLLLGDPGHELLAGGEGPALLRRPRAELAAAWPGAEVRVGLLGGERLHRALHPHLLLDQRPVEAERGPRPGAKLLRLAALEVREE